MSRRCSSPIRGCRGRHQRACPRGIEADRLELEITESVFINDSEGTDAMFRALKAIGVRLALDDFGTAIPRSAI
jgi:EAL domain-containing protein (putative c-di-GMP-specific phosphodiesterase class I)